jgi:flagellin
MSLFINSNVQALQAYNNLNSTESSLSQAVSELSSGLAIQTAADNASGYVIGQYLQEQSNGMSQAITNAQNATSLLQTAQGAFNQEEQILQQMNTLAVQSANGGVQDSASLAANQQQFVALQNELTQIANSTQYGNTQLLNGSYSNQVFQVGAFDSTYDQVTVSISASDATSLSVGIGQASIGTVAAAQAAISAVQTAISTVASSAASLGATQNELQALINNLTVGQQNIYAAHSRLVDVNVAQETSVFTADQILAQSGVTVLAQAQSLPQLALKLI